MAEPAGDLDDDLDVVARPLGRLERGLRTRCTRRSLFVTVPSASHHAARRRQDDVGQLRRPGEEDVLHDQVVEAFRAAAMACSLSASDCAGFSPIT